ncbi:hypothetical protein LTR56_011810 [Elasticomyces elasticus]|nr:hypothetical protein LTR56_011810 [Elasticomyces elasticus]KAK3666460.1 hypothetical protein LTR22_002765 [Elasticomyces elasticus]KAK4931280.1 hypothetical protein LTR49_002338 [Elasticomyces elasticus]KAK5767788.1 hypothetical protein LTS12_001940 [Elasticomyces elasticus]
MSAKRLRIAYIPEHFSTPLHFAAKHYALDADLVSEPLGTGALTARLKADTSDEQAVDVAIGLTEGFVADLGKNGGKDGVKYGLAGTYVTSPLCWAISTGADRKDVTSVESLKGKKVGVSRIGSGSYVMSYVLADQQKWLKQGEDPFGVEVIGDFAALRKSVRQEGEKPSTEFFMWEHFVSRLLTFLQTTKHFWDNGELKKVGEIYTPWPSWMIAARSSIDQEQLEDLMGKLNAGVKHYQENSGEAVEHITSTMKYSKEDAEAWMKTVTFSDDVKGVDGKVVDDTVSVLQKAGVLKAEAGGSEEMIAIKRA